MNPLRPVLVSALVLTSCLVAQAAERITWGTTLFVPDFTSAGVSVPMDSSFVFELGAFTPGFDPAANPVADWAANWQVLDRVHYDDSDAGGGLCTCAVSRRSILEANTGNFITTNQGYVWGYRCAGGQAEWILLTDPAWFWPNAGGTVFGTSWTVGANTIAVIGTLGNPGQDGFEMMSAVVTGADGPQITAVTWMAQQGTGALTADDDSDGLSNLLEFALGTDPSGSDSIASVLPWTLVEVGNARFWQITADRNPQAKVAWVLEASTDLTTWTPVDLDFDQPHNIDLPDRFQFRDPVGVGASGVPRRFLRLGVTAE